MHPKAGKNTKQYNLKINQKIIKETLTFYFPYKFLSESFILLKSMYLVWISEKMSELINPCSTSMLIQAVASMMLVVSPDWTYTN